MHDDALALIEHLSLQPHPEGGFFRETFRAPLDLGGLPHGSRRNASTAIYFLLPAGTFSAWHRVSSDEVWHFYDGDPLDLHMIDAAGHHEVVRLGRGVVNGERPQAIVPAGVWQAAVPTGDRYTLCGCTVAPGFDFTDFEMPERAALIKLLPAHRALVERFTRLAPTDQHAAHRIERRPFTPEHADALVAFCLTHPAGPHDERLLRTMLTQLPASTGHVLDLWLDGKRVLAAAVLDTVTNATDAAVLVILGYEPESAGETAVGQALAQAETLVRQGPRARLEVPLPSALASLAPALVRHGYHLAYSNYEMATADGLMPSPSRELPAPWHWTDYTESHLRAYYELVHAAFAEVPGMNIAGWDTFAAMTRTMPVVPRLLFHGEQLAGFAKVELRGAERTEGYVGSLGRHPAFRGRQLGEILLREAMQHLHVQGATRFTLNVTASNQQALALYEHHGFAIVSDEPTYSKDIVSG